MSRALVERAQQGDREAYEELALGVTRQLFLVAARIVRDPDLAQDAVQQTLVAMWRDLPSLRDPDRFEAWTYRMVVRFCRAASRRERRLGVRIVDLSEFAGCGRWRYRRYRTARSTRAGIHPTESRPPDGRRAPPLRRPVARRDRRHPRGSLRHGRLAIASCDAGHARHHRSRRPHHGRGRAVSMTTEDPFDRLVATWLERDGPQHAPAGLAEAAFATARGAGQRRGLRAALTGPGDVAGPAAAVRATGTLAWDASRARRTGRARDRGCVAARRVPTPEAGPAASAR